MDKSEASNEMAMKLCKTMLVVFLVAFLTIGSVCFGVYKMNSDAPQQTRVMYTSIAGAVAIQIFFVVYFLFAKKADAATSKKLKARTQGGEKLKSN